MKVEKIKPAWVREYLEALSRPLTPRELARRKKIYAKTMALREKANISPDKVEDYVRAIRDEESA